MTILDYEQIFMMGIKGVGMTALASCLVDAGKQVRGADVAARFPTSRNLERLGIPIQALTAPLPADTQAVVYTGSHSGCRQPLVQEARRRGLPVFSHMEALAGLFDAKKGVAVCGVGGKSTISAMIAFVCQQLRPQSYAVGVGEILGLAKTGQYLPDSEYFIAEADEYVADPTTLGTKAARIRFLYLHPYITVCPNLRFDHPDVYRDFAHTQAVFLQFFTQLRPNGILIYNGDDQPLSALVAQLQRQRSDVKVYSYGADASNDYRLGEIDFSLQLPGDFNRRNALAAMIALEQMGYKRAAVLAALREYRSVKRRLEYLGERDGVAIWDDYAHHPSEIRAAIQALREHYPQRRLVVAFQPHTYSRTKQLFEEFVSALATAPVVWLVDIFASARESFDPSVSSEQLAAAINRGTDSERAVYVGSVADLRARIESELRPGDVLLTLGAGDIYHAVTSD